MENTCSEEIIDKKFRHFMILLYKDSSIYNYDEVLFDLKGSFKNYAYINHIPEDNEKKEHTHFILSLDNTRTLLGLANRLGIPSNYIQPIRGLRASCRYLVHKDNEDKIQYDLTEVKVSNSFRNKFYSSFDDLLSDDEILNNLFIFIDDHKFLNFIDCELELALYCSRCGYDRIFKRYYNTIVKKINSACN